LLERRGIERDAFDPGFDRRAAFVGVLSKGHLSLESGSNPLL
jgi:hypothetical protein